MTKKLADDWSSKHIKLFWDWRSSNPNLTGSYFTSRVGQGIVNFISATDLLKGKVLDFGCGNGDLLGYLLDRGLACYGAEMSPHSVQLVNSRFAGRPNWHQAIVTEDSTTTYDDHSFDVITCVETIEHLRDEDLTRLLLELRRLIRPDGLIVITTPFNEDLDSNYTYCPFCQAEFHRVQHMRSFDISSLELLLSKHGLQVDFCRNLDFAQFQTSLALPPLNETSLNSFRFWLIYQKRRLLDRLFPMEFPNGREFGWRLAKGHGRHLCALARRID